MRKRTLQRKILEADREHTRRNTEKGFVNYRIIHLFTPSILKKRNYVPTCTKDEIKNYFYEYVKTHGRNCFYCKEPWTYTYNRYIVGKGRQFIKGKRRENLKNFSLDRLDNSKTYSIDNIIFCCQQCNHSKKDISIKLIKRLHEIIIERNL